MLSQWHNPNDDPNDNPNDDPNDNPNDDPNDNPNDDPNDDPNDNPNVCLSGLPWTYTTDQFAALRSLRLPAG